jgi:hypothetical protein
MPVVFRELIMSAPLYIDPTTGGLGLQLLLGFIVGGFVTIKLMWGRFLSFFSRQEEPTEESVDPNAQASTEPAVED